MQLCTTLSSFYLVTMFLSKNKKLFLTFSFLFFSKYFLPILSLNFFSGFTRVWLPSLLHIWRPDPSRPSYELSKFSLSLPILCLYPFFIFLCLSFLFDIHKTAAIFRRETTVLSSSREENFLSRKFTLLSD